MVFLLLFITFMVGFFAQTMAYPWAPTLLLLASLGLGLLVVVGAIMSIFNLIKNGPRVLSQVMSTNFGSILELESIEMAYLAAVKRFGFSELNRATYFMDLKPSNQITETVMLTGPVSGVLVSIKAVIGGPAKVMTRMEIPMTGSLEFLAMITPDALSRLSTESLAEWGTPVVTSPDLVVYAKNQATISDDVQQQLRALLNLTPGYANTAPDPGVSPAKLIRLTSTAIQLDDFGVPRDTPYFIGSIEKIIALAKVL